MMNAEMPNIPGMGSMTDTLEFVKKLWGGMGMPGAQSGASPGMAGMSGMPGMGAMNLPGMVMPTLSVDEINKRIADLKAVENWLTLNMNMLRGTIQALEVQAATLATLNAMGQSVSATMKAAGMPDPMGAAAAYGASNGASNGSASGAGAQADAMQSDSATAPEAESSAQPNEKDEQDAAALTAPLINAAAWWNTLQDQFQQAVSNAMAAEPAQPAGKSAKPKTRAGAKAGTSTNGKSASRTAAKSSKSSARSKPTSSGNGTRKTRGGK